MNERSVFLAALDKTDAAERAAYLEAACAGDDALRQQVELLLRAHVPEDSFLEKPAIALRATSAYEPLREAAGSKIGPYKLLQQIGEGGMGVVYMAEQQEPVRRKVALKIIKPGMDSAQVLARFEAERQAIALMDHQNIARIYDAGTTETGRPYFVMELVHGVPITKYCDDNHLTPKERLELFVPVCQAIQHAHQKGVIHRDIKPTNVLVCLYDGKPVPKIIDFGVAKATSQPLTERTMFTQFGTLVGTLEYMSPEQAEMSQLGIDTRSDVYSLGVLLYELLTGATPLERKRLREAAFDEVLRIIREEEPPKPSTRLSTSGAALAGISAQRKTEPGRLTRLVRGELDWIVMRALEKDRGRRYDTASGLAKDIERYLKDEPVEACPPSAGYRLSKLVRKHKTPLTAAGVFALLLLAGTIVSSWQAFRATRAETDAIEARKISLKNEETADHERAEAITANEQLRESQDDLRRTLYYARSNLLQNAWDTNNIGQVLDLLEQQRPKRGESNLCGFEWYYRDRLCHQELLTIAGPNRDPQSSIIPSYSPDGRSYVAEAKQTEGETGVALAVYDLNTGKERLRLQPDKNGSPWGMCDWSDDSKRIIVLLGVFKSRPPGETEVVAYDATTGNQIFRLKRPLASDKPITGFAGISTKTTFSANGKYLAAGWYAANSDIPPVTVIVDATTGKQIHSIHNVYAYHIALSPDGSRFAAEVENGTTIKVWDVVGGKELFSTAIKNGPVHQLAFSPDGTRLVAAVLAFSARGTSGSSILVWDAVSGQKLHMLGGNERTDVALGLGIEPRFAFTFSPDGKMLAAVLPQGVNSTDVNLWNLETGKLVETLHDSAGVSHFHFSPDGKMLAAADGSIARVWEIGATPFGSIGSPAFVFRGHTAQIVNFRFHSDDNRLSTRASNGVVKVWDLSIRQRPVTIQPYPNSGFPRGPGGPGGALGNARPFVFSAAAERLVTFASAQAAADSDELQQVKVWDLSGKLLHSYPGLRLSSKRQGFWQPSSFALSPDGKLLAKFASTSKIPQFQEAELQVLEAETGKIIYTVKESRPIRLGSIAFSPDGKRLVWRVELPGKDATDQFDTAGVEMRVLDAGNGKEIQKIVVEGSLVLDLAFNRDGTRLAAVLYDPPLRFPKSGSRQAEVVIWNANTGAKEQTLESVASRVTGLVYSRDGSRLAAVLQRGVGPGPGGWGPDDSQSEVAVWDTATGRRRYSLGHVGSFSQVTFSPDGSRLATVSGATLRPPFSPGFGSNSVVAVKIWDAATGNELLTLKDLSANTAPYLEFGPDSTRLYAVCQVSIGAKLPNQQDIEIRVWDARPRPEAKQP